MRTMRWKLFGPSLPALQHVIDCHRRSFKQEIDREQTLIRIRALTGWTEREVLDKHQASKLSLKDFYEQVCEKALRP